MIGPIAAKMPLAGVAQKPLSASVLISAVTQASAADTRIAAFDPAVLIRDLETARHETDTLAKQLRDGAKANAAAAKAARLDMARAKLKALRLAVALKVMARDAKGALKVAEEAAKVARDIKSLRSDASATAGSATPADTAAAAEEIPTATAEAAAENLPADTPAGEDGSADSAVDALLQTARKIIALARKAARPGSAEDKAMEQLQNQTGVPQLQSDIVSESDLLPAAAGRPSLDLKA
jgi:hypothetical protein